MRPKLYSWLIQDNNVINDFGSAVVIQQLAIEIGYVNHNQNVGQSVQGSSMIYLCYCYLFTLT